MGLHGSKSVSVVFSGVQAVGARRRFAGETPRARFLERSVETVRLGRLEEAAMADALRTSMERGGIGSEVSLSLQSGVFEVVSDPFPAPELRPARVLVLDLDPITTRAFGGLPGVVAVRAADIWEALTHLLEGDFDLVLCGLTFDDAGGDRICSMVSTARPELLGRIVFIGRKYGIAERPPRRAPYALVLHRPLRAKVLRELLVRIQKDG